MEEETLKPFADTVQSENRECRVLLTKQGESVSDASDASYRRLLPLICRIRRVGPLGAYRGPIFCSKDVSKVTSNGGFSKRSRLLWLASTGKLLGSIFTLEKKSDRLLCSFRFCLLVLFLEFLRLRDRPPICFFTVFFKADFAARLKDFFWRQLPSIQVNFERTILYRLISQPVKELFWQKEEQHDQLREREIRYRYLFGVHALKNEVKLLVESNNSAFQSNFRNFKVRTTLPVPRKGT